MRASTPEPVLPKSLLKLSKKFAELTSANERSDFYKTEKAHSNADLKNKTSLKESEASSIRPTGKIFFLRKK
jgi:hypothetical protein